MDRSQPTKKSGISIPGPDILFILAFVLYLWIRIDPSLLAYHDAPFFLGGLKLGNGFHSNPGGLLRAAGALIIDSGTIKWVGTVIITAVAILLCQASRIFMTYTSGGRIRAAHLVPGFLFLLVLNCYQAPGVQIGVGVAMSCVFAASYAMMNSSVLRYAVVVPATLMVYWVAGLEPGILFVALAELHEALGRKRVILGAVIALLGIASLLAFDFLPAWPLETIARRWHDKPSHVAAALLYSCLIVSTLLDTYFSKRFSASAEQQKKARPASPVTRISLAVVAAVIMVSALWFSFDAQRKSLIKIDYLAERGQWEGVLATAKELKRPTTASHVQVLRALHHAGRLSDDMFAFAQVRSVELLPGLERGGGADFCLPLAHTLYELGQVNLADHFATESLELIGDRPETLQLLIKINVAKGRLPVARAFLGFLKKHPRYRDWAEDFGRRLKEDPTCANDEEIAQVRRFLVNSDITSNNEPTFVLLEDLLSANKTNEMAFEFLMAHYLYTLDIDSFAKNLPRINDLKYTSLPKHFEEAILLYQRVRRGKPLNVPASAIRQVTQERLAQFQDVLNRCNRDMKAAEPTLASQFGDTYWFYFFYGYTPGQNQQWVKGDRL